MRSGNRTTTTINDYRPELLACLISSQTDNDVVELYRPYLCLILNGKKENVGLEALMSHVQGAEGRDEPVEIEIT